MQFNKERIETLNYLIDLDVTSSEHLIEIRKYIDELISKTVLTYAGNTFWMIQLEIENQFYIGNYLSTSKGL